MENKKIKIVKRNDPQREAAVGAPKAKSPRTVAREMVTTVSDWVSELKERKRLETKAAIDLLLSSSSGVNQS